MISRVADLLDRSLVLIESEQLDEAAELCGRILAVEPDNPEAHYELGVIALKRGQRDLAIDYLLSAIEHDSGQPRFHILLGIAYSTRGKLQEGARCFQRALELDPDDYQTHDNLGKNFRIQGKLVDAERCFRAAISVNPEFIQGYCNLGDLLSARGELSAAADAYRKALKINADLPEVKFRLAQTLYHIQDYEEVMALLRQAATIQPDFPGIDNLLGLTMMRLGKFDAASENYQKAMARRPESAGPLVNMGHLLTSRGDPAGALEFFRRALDLEPDYPKVHSNLLMAMNYLPQSRQRDLYEESVRYDLQHAGGTQRSREPFGNSRDENRVLRIGYLSPDFRSHSVAHFTWQLIGAHNRDRVEIFCYSDVLKQDAITGRFAARADHWLSIVGMSDEAVARRIREDRIDILIDLAGHTGNNRLLVFARKPAPIQVSWLGYPNTTGLQAMDYRLTDSVADPEGEADKLHTEELVRLKHGFLCYQSDDSIPEVSALPCLKAGHVTFGSFNHLPKVSPEVISTWSAILTRVPDSRLVLKAGALADANTRAKYERQFLEHGVLPDRIDLLGKIPSRIEHLETYSRVDVSLDTFPYNGTTTTFEALLMGVPVITLRGNRHAGRVSASILQHTGNAQFITESEEQYINLACELAADIERLETLRVGLRPGMLGSQPMNLALFTDTLENAYRKMWSTWCNSPTGEESDRRQE